MIHYKIPFENFVTITLENQGEREEGKANYLISNISSSVFQSLDHGADLSKPYHFRCLPPVHYLTAWIKLIEEQFWNFDELLSLINQYSEFVRIDLVWKCGIDDYCDDAGRLTESHYDEMALLNSVQAFVFIPANNGPSLHFFDIQRIDYYTQRDDLMKKLKELLGA